MDKEKSILNSNSLAFIALSNEYCQTLQNCLSLDKSEFISVMLKQLPRLYIMATDLKTDLIDDVDCYLVSALDEETYEIVRRNLEQLIGEDDVYLEVFEEDMKYSDTPVSASISEGLSDIFQVLFNFIATVRDTTDDTLEEAVAAVRNEFAAFWSSTLCNVLRALNHLAYNNI